MRGCAAPAARRAPAPRRRSAARRPRIALSSVDLPTPFGPEDGDELPGAHGQVDVGPDPAAADRRGQPAQFDHGRVRAGRRSPGGTAGSACASSARTVPLIGRWPGAARRRARAAAPTCQCWNVAPAGDSGLGHAPSPGCPPPWRRRDLGGDVRGRVLAVVDVHLDLLLARSARRWCLVGGRRVGALADRPQEARRREQRQPERLGQRREDRLAGADRGAGVLPADLGDQRVVGGQAGGAERRRAGRRSSAASPGSQLASARAVTASATVSTSAGEYQRCGLPPSGTCDAARRRRSRAGRASGLAASDLAAHES